MKKYIYALPIIGTLLACITITSCNESDELMYDLNNAGVYFYKTGGQESTDSLNYSFVLFPDAVVKDTIKQALRLRIMGQSASFDREINIKIEDSSTAVKGTHFDMPNPIIMPANAFEVYVPLYVYRTADLKTSIKSIYFTITESKDFKVGLSANKQHIIHITDQLVQPFDWDEWISTSFYGPYSVKKHEFMLQTLQTDAITMGTGASLSQMISFNQQMLVALAKYENTNGPMLDENGNRVTFPN